MSKMNIIQEIIREGEGKQIEFKETFEKVAIGKVVCSFLNSEGGQILIGVRDDKSIVGISNADSVAKELNDFLVKEVIPESPISVFSEKVGTKNVIVIEVVGGSRQPYVFQGAIYVRKGSKTAQANSSDANSLISKRQEANLHWERQTTVGADLDDLDIGEIRKTIKEITKNGKGNPKLSGDIVEFMEFYGLYKNGRITNAAMVLFGIEPTKYLPQCRVRLTIFKENKSSSEYIYDKVLESNLFKVVNQIEEFFEINLGSRSSFRNTKWKREDKLRYPKQAIREGVLNAVIHRDYSNISGSVLIAMYPDRLEISNYGGLPEELKPRDLKVNHLSLPRNPDIAHVFYMKGLIEKIGRGTIMILEETKRMGFKEPNWSVKSSVTSLTFPGITAMVKTRGKDGINDGANDGINDVVNDGINDGIFDGIFDGVNESVREGLIRTTRAIKNNPGMVAADIAKAIRKAKPTTERYIKTLRTIGIIEFIGANKTGGYYLTKKTGNKL